MACRKCTSPLSFHTGNLFVWETIDPEDGEPITMTRIFTTEACQAHLEEVQQGGINSIFSEFGMCHVGSLHEWHTDQDGTKLLEGLWEIRAELFPAEDVLFESIRLGA